MTDWIDQILHMELLRAPEEEVTLSARLSYRPHDPFAVHVTFCTAYGPISWVFARDLLTQGLRGLSGEGDVRVWPSRSGPDAVLNLALSSPHGDARLRARLPVVAAWLKRTYFLVPAGREGDELDVDAELSRLLYGAV